MSKCHIRHSPTARYYAYSSWPLSRELHYLHRDILTTTESFRRWNISTIKIWFLIHVPRQHSQWSHVVKNSSQSNTQSNHLTIRHEDITYSFTTWINPLFFFGNIVIHLKETMWSRNLFKIKIYEIIRSKFPHGNYIYPNPCWHKKQNTNFIPNFSVPILLLCFFSEVVARGLTSSP